VVRGDHRGGVSLVVVVVVVVVAVVRVMVVVVVVVRSRLIPSPSTFCLGDGDQ